MRSAWRRHLDALWVDEPHRRQGIGTRLLREYEREAKENGASAVFILEAGDVLEENAYDTKELASANHNLGKLMIALEIAKRI